MKRNLRRYKKNYIIYKITNLINGKIYIGQDSKNNPNYFGSGIAINNAIKKYNKKNFIKETIQFCKSKREMNVRERFWIKKLNSQHIDIGYNIASGGDNGALGVPKTESWKQKHRGKNNKSSRQVMFFGKRYDSINQLKNEIDRSGEWFRYRLNSLLFNDCYYISKPLININKKPSAHYGIDNPSSTPIIIDGIKYISKKEAQIKLELSYHMIRRLCGTVPYLANKRSRSKRGVNVNVPRDKKVIRKIAKAVRKRFLQKNNLE